MDIQLPGRAHTPDLNSILHPIDRFKKHWTDTELQQYMAFCIIDSNMPYERVCKAFDAIFLSMKGQDVPRHLKHMGQLKLSRLIRSTGYAYYNKAAAFLIEWANSDYSKPQKLRAASRGELVGNIKGIGDKLASMFLRNTRGDNVAVLDRHVIRWLGIRNYKASHSEYLRAEEKFLARAKTMKMTPYQLDIRIWEQMRVKARPQSKVEAE